MSASHFVTEFLEDGLLAKEMGRLEAKRALHRPQLMALRESADAAYANYLDAEEKRVPTDQLARLKITSDALQEKLAAEEKIFAAFELPSSTSSVNLIHAGLGIREEFKTSVRELKAAAPLRTFSPQDMKKINEHYSKLPENLQKLMDAAINESILLELLANPVFIRGEGHIYDMDTIRSILAKGEPARCPLNQDKNFSRVDIVPCNSLIKAMAALLDIIGGEEKTPVPVGSKLSTLLPSHARKRVSAELVELIERNYQRLPGKHKLLFDAICRDPQTKAIMDDPVMLPDGYVYDRTTATAYLTIMGGQCPANADIKFNEADITPCHFVIRVLDQLKENIIEAVKAAKKASAPAKSEPEGSATPALRK